MQLISLKDTTCYKIFLYPLMLCCLVYSCNITRKAPRDKPYLVKNTIDVSGGNFNKLERGAVTEYLTNQLDDSSQLTFADKFFVIQVLKSPPAFDTAYAALSAANMKAAMRHLGYYNTIITPVADTNGREVSVLYKVAAGNPTLIDTFSFRLADSTLQQLAMKSKDKAILEENRPVTKAGVLGEISRVVDTFRNNGYYKFTAAELSMRGDTTIAALTTVTDDPFEQLRLLAEAQAKRDSPEIKLAMILNKPEDSTRLNQFTINKIYILQDFREGDKLEDTVNINQLITRNFIIRYHEPLFRAGFLARNIAFRPGNLYSQAAYNQTLSNLAKTNVWQSINIIIREVGDSSKLDMIIEGIPVKKFGFEAAVEASYSASSTNSTNVLSGNLVGISGNLTLINRNIGREGINMTHRLRAGLELNNNSRGTNTGIVNSNELSYSNNVLFPRNISFWPVKRQGRAKPGESFITTNLSINNRLQLFSLQSANIAFGKNVPSKKNNNISTTTYTFKPLNAEFSYLFNESDSFLRIKGENPFLRYAYNTSFVIGMAGGISNVYRNPKHLKSLSKERSIKINAEESGLTWGLLPIINKYKSKYVKLDAEYKYTVNYPRTAVVFRAFAGIGVPLFKDSSLPFFKQFIGGGSSSMRGWPIRGIGRGGQPLAPYKQNIFNDRTGDMQLELNGEYRYDIARIIPNVLTLRGALFVDIGNIWNLNNSKTDGTVDTAVFKFKNLYQQLGMSAGTGFRLDFNYVVLRFDLGFRFKRPETSYINDGWKAPPIGFDDFFKKIFTRGKDDVFRKWRYENFNFTIGISYPF